MDASLVRSGKSCSRLTAPSASETSSGSIDISTPRGGLCRPGLQSRADHGHFTVVASSPSRDLHTLLQESVKEKLFKAGSLKNPSVWSFPYFVATSCSVEIVTVAKPRGGVQRPSAARGPRCVHTAWQRHTAGCRGQGGFYRGS